MFEIHRTVAQFPTRQYPYMRASAQSATLEKRIEPLEGIPAGSVVRFFLGQDESAAILEPTEFSQHVNDPFAKIVLMAGLRPNSLLEVLEALDAATGTDVFSEQRIYRVADGGQIPWSDESQSLDRHLRIVITRHRGDEAELLVSTAAPFSSHNVFLQVFAWDPVSKAYNFYERRQGVWSWTGSSWEALSAPTRGRGPFDSHVNGNPVMKELKLPWMHWHSQSAMILDDILAPDDPLRTDPLYQSSALKGGEDLERIVRAGISRWTTSRFERFTSGKTLHNAPDFLRHLLTTTTINLVSSPQPSASIEATDLLRLPTTFFVNADCLIEDLKIPAALPRLSVKGEFYLDCLKRYNVELRDGDHILKQDGYFAFAVPEPSTEDRMVVIELVQRGFVSRKLAACLLMVDFENPVCSDARSSLLQYMPERVLADGTLDVAFVEVVRAAHELDASDGTKRFLTLWDAADDQWASAFARKIETFWSKLRQRLSDRDGFDQIFRLAEFRRRQFRKRPLSEFGLTLPVATSLDLPDEMRMTSEATIEVQGHPHGAI